MNPQPPRRLSGSLKTATKTAFSTTFSASRKAHTLIISPMSNMLR
ncbi:hypothetical protein M7I_1663 [Glarea lozoyensis 74030]|uniref:Uncharacterized protein n=1 Tax=Glarea lozoyensis (strain ATCC 74030 / MF5533) TaxID=1104152 RepID=H0EGP4_GLAL7|nr:hypothetical protein M7I_1663 [Glarea lozoyensis 74030]